MVLAWGVLVPIGVIAARYFKILPTQNWPDEVDNRVWWNTHQACQYSAAFLTIIAVILIRASPERTWIDGVHYLFGWTIVGLAALQVLGGLLRGTKGGPTEPAPNGSLDGDHFSMTPRRIIFEYAHKLLGYSALLLMVCAIMTGIWQANAPRWMPIALVIWWTALIILSMQLQKRGMCVDTYQALWGPDPSLPGNQLKKPIGFRVRRFSAEAHKQKRNYGPGE